MLCCDQIVGDYKVFEKFREDPLEVMQIKVYFFLQDLTEDILNVNPGFLLIMWILFVEMEFVEQDLEVERYPLSLIEGSVPDGAEEATPKDN